MYIALQHMEERKYKCDECQDKGDVVTFSNFQMDTYPGEFNHIQDKTFNVCRKCLLQAAAKLPFRGKGQEF